uniref:Uncharacterized protein n=2 Tax=Physcomitrium patens TaxID=3218 RepID=A0A2K1JGU4_PHYPA|nr:hypothetical protein PHYPA_018185 [Physcomitrium patens]
MMLHAAQLTKEIDTSSTLLDHIVCEEGLLVDPIKIKAIISLLRLKKKKKKHEFMDSTNYQQLFICNFVNISQPLTNLTKSCIKYA